MVANLDAQMDRHCLRIRYLEIHLDLHRHLRLLAACQYVRACHTVDVKHAHVPKIIAVLASNLCSSSLMMH